MKKRGPFKTILAGLASVVLCLVLVDIAILQQEIKTYKHTLPSIQAEIEHNLAVVPKDTHWTPLLSWVPYPKLIGARTGGYLGGSRINVELASSRKVKSACLCILDALEPETPKSDVVKKLKGYGVKDKMLQNLTGSGGNWESHRGKYSLTITDY